MKNKIKTYDLKIFPAGEIAPYFFKTGCICGKEKIGGLLIKRGQNAGGVITRKDCLKLKKLIETLIKEPQNVKKD